MFENKQRAWLESGSEMVRKSRTSLGTLVPRAYHDDNNSWYLGLDGLYKYDPFVPIGR
jgi:hypothetical protein